MGTISDDLVGCMNRQYASRQQIAFDPMIPRYSIGSLRGLIEQSCRLGNLIEEYNRYEIEVPADLIKEKARIERDVKASHRAELEGRLAAAQALVEELRSREEKRETAEAEIEKLKDTLSRY